MLTGEEELTTRQTEDGVLVIQIPESEIMREFGWLEGPMGESAVTLFLIRHPETICDGAELVGIEVGVPIDTPDGKTLYKSVDCVFRKGGKYYIVEVKRWGRKEEGKRAALKYVQGFKKRIDDIRESRGIAIEYDSLVPTVVTTTR